MELLQELLRLNEMDNGPKGRVKTDKINYSSKRNMTGYGVSKEELAERKAKIKAERDKQIAARKAYEKLLKMHDEMLKPQKPDLDKVARKIEEVVGDTFPDSDPIDHLGPWLKKTYNIDGLAIGETLDKAVKKIGKYKDYFDYLATTWDDFTRDFPELNSIGRNPWK